jgi:hypothetical protein
MDCSATGYAQYLEQRGRIEVFLQRAVDEGLIRADLPDGMAWLLLHGVVDLVAHQYPDLDSGRAADLAVDVLLGGIGRN